ncbi:hypothetical protein JB92DRAFT_243534 [Gautieria morchelliformis]|nr:hypothetical protein JB92DRAFT_243534 [Gautieria morchelliformis]
MPSYMKLLTLAATVAVGVVTAAPSVDHAKCAGAQLVSSTTLHVGGHDVLLTTHSCSPSAVERRQTTPTTFVNVCGSTCTTSCNSVTGILPPISDDCQTIENAIVILQSTMSSTFLVQPNHLKTLTFGTCSYFFENIGPTELQSCWADLSSFGHAAGAACFPPVQPFFPEGLCTAYDGTWAVGATHS